MPPLNAALNLNSTTPAAPTGSVNVTFQSDGATPMVSVSAYDPIMVGDTGSGGVSGNVPAPAAGDAASGMYLSAAGTWAIPAGGGGGGGSSTDSVSVNVSTTHSWGLITPAVSSFMVINSPYGGTIELNAMAPTGSRFGIKNAGTGVVYVATTSGNIDGVTFPSVPLSLPGQSLDFEFDGTDFWIR